MTLAQNIVPTAERAAPVESGGGPSPKGLSAFVNHAIVLLPWIALVSSLFLTWWAYDTVKSNSWQVAQTKFEFRNAEILAAIKRRMTTYAQTLQGGVALFKSSSVVTRDEWRTYVSTLELNRFFPGIQGFGYAEFVPPHRLPAYEARIRAEGFPTFRIRPPGPRKVYSSITFLEPFDIRNRQAFGYDMYSQITRRTAMDKARDTGKITISGRVTLVQEISDDVQAGFLMYAPYYGKGENPKTKAGRSSRILGYVYSPFRMRDLMEGILGPGLPNVRLKIFDGNSEVKDNLMYDSLAKGAATSPKFIKKQLTNVGEHQWTLRVTSQPEFERYLDPEKNLVVLAAGLIASLLLFAFTWSFANTRRRAQVLADQMTETIKRHAQELARSNGELEQFAYIASHDLKAPLRGIDHLASWIETDLGEFLVGESRDHMTLLRQRISRMEALLKDLLDFSRAGRVETPIETVNLRELIQCQFDWLNVEKKFTLTLDMEDICIETRRTELEQIFGNLFSNAIKYHDQPNGRLEISVKSEGDYYVITVADDGPGVPPEFRERIFQMFQTLRPRDEVEGSGMGLAIIRKIIERQGGKISAENRPGGRGVQFRFFWPNTMQKDSET